MTSGPTRQVAAQLCTRPRRQMGQARRLLLWVLVPCGCDRRLTPSHLTRNRGTAPSLGGAWVRLQDRLDQAAEQGLRLRFTHAGTARDE